MTATDETTILEILDERVAAHAAKDPARIVAPFAPGAVRYALDPPLQHVDAADADPADLVRWLATFDGPIELTYRDPVVMADGDVAFVHSLSSMTATPAGTPEPFTLWFRASFGLRRTGGAWRIVHEHTSTPFYMDGSFRAATDLLPL